MHFNARFRDELLNCEVFYSLREGQILIEEWRKHYNTKCPHSALGYRPPAPESIVQMDQRPVMHQTIKLDHLCGLITLTQTIGLLRADPCAKTWSTTTAATLKAASTTCFRGTSSRQAEMAVPVRHRLRLSRGAIAAMQHSPELPLVLFAEF